MNLILASSSVSRRALLDRLTQDYVAVSPSIDESAKDNETTEELVVRLAKEKAIASADKHNQDGLYIGSDQVAICDGEVLGKPHTTENAIAQLSKFSGKTITFLTSLCLYNSVTKNKQLHTDVTKVHFRELSLEEIKAYVDKEQPLHCAGSFKSEGLGIHLFKAIENNDPSALIGLPLIKLCEFLRNEGYTFL